MAKEMTEAQAYKHIQSMFGEDTVFHPDEIEQVEAFSTRSPSLDRALQVGGWAQGRIYQVAGKPSSGKTFMTLLGMAEWQSKDPENCCCFIDAEYTYDPEWASSLGIDNDRVMLVKTNDGKQIFTGLVGTPKKNKSTGEIKNIPGLLDMIRDGVQITHKVNGKSIKLNLAKMGIIVLDSIAAMKPPVEAESEVGKIQIAPLSRFLTVELRKLTPAVADANVCFIAINHVKTKVGVMFGNPQSTPGGAAWHHACSVELMVAPISGADAQLFDNNKEKIGHKIRIKVEKNKMGRPYKKAEFFIDFTSGIAKKEEELLELGVLYGLIERPNNRSYIINEEKFTSKANALEHIKEHLNELEKKIRFQYLENEDISLEGENSPTEF